MEKYNELESLGFFKWLSETHNLVDTDMESEYLDKLPLNDMHITVCNSMAFRWFRDNHQLFYTIETNCSQLSFEWGFDYTIYDKENDKWLSTEPQNCPAGETTYKTYEEAESACINKLIEIVKKK